MPKDETPTKQNEEIQPPVKNEKKKKNVCCKVLIVFTILAVLLFIIAYKEYTKSYKYIDRKLEDCHSKIIEESREASGSMTSLQRKMSEVQGELNACRAHIEELKPRVPNYSTVVESGFYQSRFGFSIRFPTDWTIDTNPLESYSTLTEANKYGGSHFSIINPELENYAGNSGGPIENPFAKLEVYVLSGNVLSVDEFVASKDDLLRSERFSAAGGAGVKVWQPGIFAEEFLTFYLPYKNVALKINCYPYDSMYMTQIDNILKSVDFTF